MSTDPAPLFISYRSIDRALAQALHDRLQAAGFHVWFDVEALDRVGQWHELIEAGCEQARLILPVLTPRWQSLWTEYETYGGEAVVPLVFEGEFPQIAPPALHEWQGMVEDMRDASDETWEKLFRRLREYLKEPAPEKSQRVRDLPFGPNPYFVGREQSLLDLHEKLCQAPATVLTHGPAFVLEGLGGVGKTTLARQYVEKFWRLYRDILWVSAANPELLPLEFARLAEKLGVAVGDDVDANARRALEELTRGPRRLLIIDNAHDEESIQDWLPKSGKCRTIITSRFTGWSAEVQSINVHVLDPEPARQLLLRRSGLPNTEVNAAAADRLAQELGYLPLALEQAAAYIQQQHGNLERYLEQFERYRQQLLARRQAGATRYPDSVATTWRISVEQLGPAALNILRLLAFLAPDPLPRWVLRQAGDILGGLDELALDEALMELHRYSLIELEDDDGPLTIHRLLQAVQEDGLEAGERRGWLEKALKVVERAFPEADYSNWQVCEEMLGHAVACCRHIEKYDLLIREAGLLPWLVGAFFQERGEMSAALQPLEQAVRTYEHLAVTCPTRGEGERGVFLAQSRLGNVRMALGDLAGAGTAYERAHAVVQRVSSAHPGDTGVERDLSVSYIKLGDVRVAEGSLVAARAAYEAALTIRERLAAADAYNHQWQRDLSIVHEKLGDLFRALGDLSGAQRAYEARHDVAIRLSAENPANHVLLRDLGLSYERIAIIRQARGDHEEALEALEARHLIATHLATADPGNARWQRDLSVSWNNLGDARKAHGDLPGAQAAHEASIALAERLVVGDPANSGGQLDLSFSYVKLGDVLRAQDDAASAVEAYEQSLLIRRRLADADPNNAQWQRELCASCQRVGDAQLDRGDLQRALAAYETAHENLRHLISLDRSNLIWQRDLAVVCQKLGDVLLAERNNTAAFRAQKASLSIRERLAATNPESAEAQRDLAVSSYRLAAIHHVTGQLEQEKARLRQCREVLRGMRDRGMHLDPPAAALLEQLEGLEG